MMIRRTVRRRFRAVYWNRPPQRLGPRTVFVVNHHGWHDGYLMFHVVSQLQTPTLDWIQEYASFPLFGRIGGMPFPADKPQVRAATIRQTIRKMTSEGWSLCLFAEGTLHRPPDVWPLGRSLDLIRRQVPDAVIVPVALVYDMSLHERPEAFVRLGEPILPRSETDVHATLVELLQSVRHDVQHHPDAFEVLVRGTLDVNERWDVRRAPRL